MGQPIWSLKGLQFDFGLPEMAPRGYSWRRYPQLVRAYYELLLDGEPTEVWVMHCGHPTALRGFYVTYRGDIADLPFFGRSTEAKEAAVEWHKQRAQAQRGQV